MRGAEAKEAGALCNWERLLAVGKETWVSVPVWPCTHSVASASPFPALSSRSASANTTDGDRVPTLTFYDLRTHSIVLASFIDNEGSSSVLETFSNMTRPQVRAVYE